MRIELPELTGGRCGASAGFLTEREDYCNGYPVYSGSFVCTACLTEWARLTWTTPERDIFEIRGLLCTACAETHLHHLHRDLRPVPGSLGHNPTVNTYDVALLEDLAGVLIEREFNLHMQYYKESYE